MGLRSIGAVKDTTDVELYDPKTSETLRNADGTPMTITIHGPYSARYRKISDEQRNRRLARAQRANGVSNVTAEEMDASALATLIACVEAWNITVADEPEKFSEAAVRAVFAEFPWVREQVDAAFGDTKAFLTDTSAT